MRIAKEKLMETRKITTEMEKDGLINPNEEFTIEFKNNELLINGKKQSKKLVEKYRKYSNGKDFEIHKNRDDSEKKWKDDIKDFGVTEYVILIYKANWLDLKNLGKVIDADLHYIRYKNLF